MARYILKDNKFAHSVFKNLKGVDKLGFDTETTGFLFRADKKDEKVVSIVLATRNNSYYIPINHKFYNNNFKTKKLRKYLQPIFSDSNTEFIAHNYNFDRHVLNRIGIEISSKNYFDTLIAARMVNEEVSNDLESCIERYLGVKDLTKFNDVVSTVPTEVKKKAGLSAQSKATIDLVDINIAANYGVEDVEYLIKLSEILKEGLKKEGMYTLYYKYIVPEFSDVIYNIEKRGVNIDNGELDRMEKEITEDIINLEKQMNELAGLEMNHGSNVQLAELLYNEYSSDSPCDNCKLKECKTKKECEEYKIWEKYGHKNPNIEIRENSFNFPVPERTKTGQPSSGKIALNRFQHYTPKNKRQEEGLEYVELLKQYKKLTQLKSTFLSGLRDVIYNDGKVHPAFNILGTKTGRLSSNDPNGQNLPSPDEEDKYKIRKMFIPSKPENRIIAVDYDNLEMKLLAHFSKDEHLLEMFENDYDAHGTTAVNMLDLDCHPNDAKKLYPVERQMGKTLNFSLMYGMSPHTLYYKLMDNGVDLEDKELQDKYGAYSGMELAKVIYDKYFDTYQGVASYIEEQKERGRQNEEVFTLLGRKKRLPLINTGSRKERGYFERLATNGQIQGSAADIIISAQLKLERNKILQKLNAKQLFQVHDEQLFELPKKNLDKAIPIIVEEMEDPFNGEIKMNVNLTVSYDTGNSYYEAK